MAVLVITAADVTKIEGDSKIVTWGESITPGQLVYPGADSQYVRTDASDKAKLGPSVSAMGVNASTAMALTSGSVNQQGIVLAGLSRVNVGNVLIKGTMYYASQTPGGICLETDLASSINEVQRIASSGATSGTLTITFDGQTTAAIPYNATAADVKTAMEALSNVDLVAISGGPLNSADVDIEFQGVNAAKNLAAITLDTTGLVGGVNGVSTVTEGVAGSYLFIAGYAESETDLRLMFSPTGIQR